MDLVRGELFNVVYEKVSDGEVTERRIVPVFTPYQTVRAIDVSNLDKSEQQQMTDAVREYGEYLDQHAKRAFNFETWYEQTQGKAISPKWRAFKLANIRRTTWLS